MQLIVLVGQSRSGSTLLTRLMNEGGRAAIINDAYVLQLAEDQGLRNTGSGPARDRFVSAWLQRIRERTESVAPASIHKSLVVPPELFQRLATSCAENATSWEELPQLVEGPLRLLAQLLGAEAYGWNTPPDYAEAGDILKRYPESKMVFLIREPFSVLLSYKLLPEYWGDERSRYNPVLQALVWRQVVRRYESVKETYPRRALLLRYEDLVRDPACEIGRIADFCGVPFSVPELDRIGSNSSREGKAGVGLSRLEYWMCHWITGSVRARYAYQEASVAKLPEWGVAPLLTCLVRSGRYYATRALTSRDIRARLLRFAKQLVSRQI